MFMCNIAVIQHATSVMAKSVCVRTLTKTVMLSMPSLLVKRFSVYSISFSSSDSFRKSRDWERFKPIITGA